MKSIVITGSTRGLGYGLASAFLALGNRVVISGRTGEGVDRAVAKLSSEHSSSRLFGYPCDVTQPKQVEALWDAARSQFGRVDIWINNAGIAHVQTAFWDLEADLVEAVVRTNVIGAMYGAKVALRGMREQGFGSLYNMEGLGSGGRRVEGLTLYGCTKSSLCYLTDALVQEVRETPILVGALRPGMVLTDMLTKQYEGRPEDWERARRVFNLLADRVETVAPWMARKVLANERNGVRIRWLTRRRLLSRVLTGAFRKRELSA